MYKQVLAIAVGASCGAVCRWWVVLLMQRYLGAGYPWATLLVNALGSFILGFLVVYFLDRSHLSDLMRLMLTVGFLGSFTTFSTFSVETVRLMEQGAVGVGLLHIVGSVVLCVSLAWLGMLLAKMV
ncbi:MAG: fluoride efflux transporter CrcB [Mariprofundaceae bacterium]|nr:fluoride efflux transporter CrcB [Mariprofundaceae bacterium]